MNAAAFRILIADDEESIRSGLGAVLKSEGYEVITASGGAEACEAAERETVHIALVDLTMPDMNGIEVLKCLKERSPGTRVIIITAYASAETAVEAMKQGALDYLIKPFTTDELKLQLRRAVGEVALAAENQAMRREFALRFSEEIVGEDGAFKAALALARRVAADTAIILITGETGTGKELVAREIHSASRCFSGPFLAINCAAIPETMLERELFGHEKGSFTGADAARPGLIEAAADGTLFLDEIGEMPPSLQVKILRVIEGLDFLRIGGTKPVRVHARFVVATNRDLPKLAAEGKFREDLFYRLNVINVKLPPLRERGNDIGLLAKHFLAKFAAEKGKKGMTLSPGAATKLQAYPWPGNVRELKNVIERAVILGQDGELAADSLALEPAAGGDAAAPDLSALSFREAHDAFEKSFIARCLKANRGNISKTAERIGLDRKNLEDKIRKYGLK